MKSIYGYQMFQTQVYPELVFIYLLIFPMRVLTNLGGIASFNLQLWTTLPVWVVPSGHTGWIST